MTTEEFRESAARAIEAKADILGPSPVGPLHGVGFREGLRHAAEIVRSLPVASPWIPVGERLPEPDVFVICYHDVYRTLASMGRDGEWREYDGTAIYPTHWMPLPEPPTEPAS